MITKNFLIGFIHFTEDKQEEYIEKYFKHEYDADLISSKQIEKYLVKKYEKIIAEEYDIDIDNLCISTFKVLQDVKS